MRKGLNMFNLKILSTWWSCICYNIETLQFILLSTDIKNYAHAYHDKDIHPETGKPKEPHYHFLIQFMRNQRGSWFKRFLTDVSGNIMIEPTRDPLNSFNYLIHDTDRCRKEGQHQYDPNIRTSTFDNSDFDDFEKKDTSDKIKTQDLRKMILADETTPTSLNLAYNLSPQQMDIAERLYIDHKNKTLMYDHRPIKCTYIHGKPRIGKTTHVTQKYDPKEFCRVSSYKNPFDSYAYQKVLILDEYDSQLDIEYINNILDKFPCELACRFKNKWAGWETVYVISNIPLIDQYKEKNHHPDKIDAFRSRFNKVIHIDKQNKKTPQQLSALSNNDANDLGF